MPKPIDVVLGLQSKAVRLLLASLMRDDPRFGVVVDVSTAAETIERAPDADLIVVDLLLPDGDAFSTIEHLRTAGTRAPVVILAEVDPPYLRFEATANGAADFFVHATNPDVLLDGFAGAATSVDRTADR